jgi:hypothetical protein
MRLKRWRVVNGHGFKYAQLDGNGYRAKAGRDGIICYNCGVWTVHPRRDELVDQKINQNTLSQCPMFHMDLFGGPMFMSKDLKDQIPRRRGR